MRKVKNRYLQYFYEENGAYGLDWTGYEILEKEGDDFKVVGCIPVGVIGSPERFQNMEDQELEELVEYYIAYNKFMQSIDNGEEELPF